MIIYVSKDNEKLISCLKDKVNSSKIQTITGVKYLKKIVLQEMKNLNNFESIVIDITGLSDSEELKEFPEKIEYNENDFKGEYIIDTVYEKNMYIPSQKV